jgi:hypothetical protein
MGKLIDLTGQTFERLTVIKRGKNKGKIVKWLCNCSCGMKDLNIQGNNLKSGHTTSCGCFQKEKFAKLKTTHGMSYSTELKIYNGIKQRCNNINSDAYYDYGGRGIIVCDRWLESFENFYLDMGPRPSLDYSIERIDVNGNYEPNNCKWASYEEQMINRRSTKINGFEEADHIRKEYATGEFTMQEIADYYNCKRQTISYIINNITWRDNE